MLDCVKKLLPSHIVQRHKSFATAGFIVTVSMTCWSTEGSLSLAACLMLTVILKTLSPGAPLADQRQVRPLLYHHCSTAHALPQRRRRCMQHLLACTVHT